MVQVAAPTLGSQRPARRVPAQRHGPVRRLPSPEVEQQRSPAVTATAITEPHDAESQAKPIGSRVRRPGPSAFVANRLGVRYMALNFH